MEKSVRCRFFLEAYVECMTEVITQSDPQDGRLYCPPLWDTWGCWNYTLAGTRSFIGCPKYKKGFDPSFQAYRDCNPDGTWWVPPGRNNSWANYTQCINTLDLERDKQVIYLFIAGYATSILASVISLIIFSYFRQISCDRITIHKNLFLSYILNGVVWILYYTLAAMNGQVLDSNPTWCRVMNGVTQYLVSCNFFWMFCEGFYLHTIIVFAFITRKKLLLACFVLGWAVPVIPSILYSSLRAVNEEENQSCWLDGSPKQWIVVGPILATIMVNLVFLCNIVRVLVTKLRSCNNPDTNQTRKAARAILILIPLLGLQYILFPFQPEEDTIWEDIYKMASALVTSFQGLFVALIFCFFNGEVLSVMKRKWGQHKMVRDLGKSTVRSATTICLLEQRH